MAPTTSHVVIIGGSYTGIGVANELLKNPAIKVTLINPSPDFYFNLASPRLVAKPDVIPLDKVLIPLTSVFAKYPASSFTLLLGSVTSLDIPNKSVTVTLSPSESSIEASGTETLTYTHLVIASGSSTPATDHPASTPFKSTGYSLRSAVQKAQSRIASASSIVIAGAGPVGVETAAEIAEAYPSHKVTLISSGARVLTELKPAASATAEKNLKTLGVAIIKNTKVTSATDSSGKWAVTLSDGKVLSPDVYIAAIGVIPNSSFVDASYKDSAGWVNVDDQLKVTDGVWALGDVTTLRMRYLMKAVPQIPVVAGNIAADIKGAAGVNYKPNTMLMEFVPTGSKSGTGQLGPVVVWSFMVSMMKGKDFFVGKARSFVGLK